MDIQTASDILGDIAAQSTSQEIWEAVDIAKDAMSYRMAYEPINRQAIPFSVDNEEQVGKCPRCGVIVRSNQECCDWCGQKLRWEE